MPLTQEDFIDALDRGDAKGAAEVLRQLEQLDGDALAALADMLDGEPCMKHFHPYKLRPAGWTKGKPSNRLLTKAASTTRALMVVHALNKCGKLEAALAEVGSKTGKSRSTLLNDLSALTKKSKSPAKS